jgi:hypothetical protein
VDLADSVELNVRIIDVKMEIAISASDHIAYPKVFISVKIEAQPYPTTQRRHICTIGSIGRYTTSFRPFFADEGVGWKNTAREFMGK